MPSTSWSGAPTSRRTRWRSGSTANEEDASDVVQEAYLRAWKGIRRFRGDAQFTTWMYRITANAASTMTQRRTPAADDPHRRRRRARRDAPRAPARGGGRVGGRPRRAVGRRRRSCPPKLRAIVVLKDVYGLSHEDIAEELGISVAAAKVRLHRGRKKLRDLLYEDHGRQAHAV